MSDLQHDLRELVAEWRETPEYLKLHRGKYEAADELVEVLDEHMDPEVKELVAKMEDAT